jgi:hypothetical protein
MSEIGVLVKVPAELHSELKRASTRHQRSMQKVMLALLEGWIENGAPDPLSYGSHQEHRGNTATEDAGAREALIKMAEELKKIDKRLVKVENDNAVRRVETSSFPEFFEALRRAEERISNAK